MPTKTGQIFDLILTKRQVIAKRIQMESVMPEIAEDDDTEVAPEGYLWRGDSCLWSVKRWLGHTELGH